jgi:hypothetical protein
MGEGVSACMREFARGQRSGHSEADTGQGKVAELATRGASDSRTRGSDVSWRAHLQGAEEGRRDRLGAKGGGDHDWQSQALHARRAIVRSFKPGKDSVLERLVAAWVDP